MHNPTAVFESTISNLPLINRGKVRDIYDLDGETMLIVTTDRVSAFDVILPNPIPGKGQVLTSVSNFWFEKTKSIIPNHLTGISTDSFTLNAAEREQLAGRAIVVKKLNPLPVEAIVRGYIIGSGWKDYQQTGTICNIPLPSGLQQAERLPEAIFTPSSKAESGRHDENISFDQVVSLVGVDIAEKVKDFSLKIYNLASLYALTKGIIIADTKFEFGIDKQGDLYLIDEVLTPDSSRFWPVDRYQTGISPPSFDKQYIRDYLETLDWNKQPPGPELPAPIIAESTKKYMELKNRLIEN